MNTQMSRWVFPFVEFCVFESSGLTTDGLLLSCKPSLIQGYDNELENTGAFGSTVEDLLFCVCVEQRNKSENKVRTDRNGGCEVPFAQKS